MSIRTREWGDEMTMMSETENENKNKLKLISYIQYKFGEDITSVPGSGMLSITVPQFCKAASVLISV